MMPPSCRWVLLGLVFAPPLFAQSAPSTDEALRHYQRARELYDENNFPAALVEMRRAQELSRSYKLLYDVGQICFQMHDYPCAQQSFSRYLDEGKSEVPAARRSEVQEDLKRLSARIATVRVTSNVSGCEVSLDDAAAGVTPLREPLVVSLGRHRIGLRCAGSPPQTRAIEVAGGDATEVPFVIEAATPVPSASVNASSTPTSAPAPVPSTPATTTSSRPLWIGWTLAAGLAVGAGVVGGLALSSSSDLKDKINTFGTPTSEVQDARVRTRNLALTTDVLIGLTAITAGVTLWLTLSEPSSDAPTVKAGIGPRGLQLQGSF